MRTFTSQNTCPMVAGDSPSFSNTGIKKEGPVRSHFFLLLFSPAELLLDPELDRFALCCERVSAGLQTREDEFSSRICAGDIDKLFALEDADREEFQLLTGAVEDKADDLVVLDRVRPFPAVFLVLETCGKVLGRIEEQNVRNRRKVLGFLLALALAAKIFFIGEDFLYRIAERVRQALPGKVGGGPVARLDVGDRCLGHSGHPAQLDLGFVSFYPELS